MGLRAMAQGNSRRQQVLMRARVGAQAFTIMAVVGYMFTNVERSGMTRAQREARQKQQQREAAAALAAERAQQQ